MNKHADKRNDNTRKKTYKGRLAAALVFVIVTIVLEVVYFTYHIPDNRNNIIQAYKDNQAQTVQLLADTLKGMDEDEMADFISHSVPVSGTTWGFLVKNDGVVYMKDEDTTRSLEYISTIDEFDSYMESLGGVVSENEISGSEYTCGIFADTDYVLEKYGVYSMEFYIIIALTATILVFGCILIEFAGRVGHEGRKVIALQTDLAERNEKFDEYERLTDQYEEELRNRDIDKTEMKREGYFDMDIVDTLLRKSSDPELYPIVFMYIRIRMGDRYFSRDAIFRIMDFIKGSMGKNHITAEISKGYFVVIMYKTDADTAEKKKAEILEKWGEFSKGSELEAVLRSVAPGENPRQVFYHEKDRLIDLTNWQ